jgi:NADH-quinone oxidoreductase subunit G
VVFPVAAVAEKAGTFVNWEGRPGAFAAALAIPAARTDLQVLAEIADAMDVHLALPDLAAARRELAELGAGTGEHVAANRAGHRTAGFVPPPRQPAQAGQAALATWHNLLDAGRMQDGEPNLAGTARAAVALMSAATAAEAGVSDGARVTIGTDHGTITVPARIGELPDRVVWLPTNSAGCAVRRELGAGHGALVTVRSAQ